MKGIFLGCTEFSEEILKHIIARIPDFEVQAIFSIPEAFNISYSEDKVKNVNYRDLRKYSIELDIPFLEVDNTAGRSLSYYSSLISDLNPDVILVMGWYYMVPKKVRKFAKYGAWGIHASLLPKYAGGAPLVWAIINGEEETGVTLFQLDDGVDDGDIIKQSAFKIGEDETIKEVYQKAIMASKEILSTSLSNKSQIEMQPQNKSKIEVYPQRKPEDGEINWEWDVRKIKNFIRAQTRPYPGAWTKIGDKKITIWDADIEKIIK